MTLDNLITSMRERQFKRATSHLWHQNTRWNQWWYVGQVSVHFPGWSHHMRPFDLRTSERQRLMAEAVTAHVSGYDITETAEYIHRSTSSAAVYLRAAWEALEYPSPRGMPMPLQVGDWFRQGDLDPELQVRMDFWGSHGEPMGDLENVGKTSAPSESPRRLHGGLDV